MVTTRREESRTSYYDEQKGSGIALLERKVPASYTEFTQDEKRGETTEEARERMQRNLDKLLNYDRYAESGYMEEIEVAKTETVESVVETSVVDQSIEEVSLSDEDIKPTSTTLQFGDGEVDLVYSDMEKQKESQKQGYQLNGKGKLVLVLYSLAVTVILALIVLNTGVLTSLKSQSAAKTEILNQKVAEYSVLSQEIDSVSSDAYVIEQAEGLGMVKGN
ncbi:MAG: hypothetical protein IJW43_04300 [Clostridia bacterium]|nr:hypothetical protein [Clostridia bacterium]